MSDDIEVGDRVAWSSSGGKSVGRVEKKLTKPIDIKGHHVAASADNPEFLVESDEGGRAAHKPASLKKAGAGGSKPVAAKSKARPARKNAAKRPAKK